MIVFDVLLQDIAMRDHNWSSVHFKALVQNYNLVEEAEIQKEIDGALNKLWQINQNIVKRKAQ